MVLTPLIVFRNLYGSGELGNLKADLEARYKHAHSNKSSSGYSMFLTRCRKLRDIRNLGLQYVIFFPQLAMWAEKLTSKEWELCKAKLPRLDVLNEVDKRIALHCPQWLAILHKAFPRWGLGSLSTDQALSGSGDHPQEFSD